MLRRGSRFGNVPLPMLLLLGGGGLLLVVIVVIVVMMSKKESNTYDKGSTPIQSYEQSMTPVQSQVYSQADSPASEPVQSQVYSQVESPAPAPQPVNASLSTVGCGEHQITLNNSKLSSLQSTRTKFVNNNCPTTCAAIIDGSLCQRNGQRANAKLENGNYYSM